MYNVHGHIFNIDYVAPRFLGKFSEWLIKNPEKRVKTASKILTTLSIFKSSKLDKFAKFLTTIGKTQRQILAEWKTNYPEGTKFCVLTIDMENMGAGKPKKPYLEQVKEVIEIAKEDSNVLPFIMVDPYSKNINELYYLIVENIDIIAGIKYYPTMSCHTVLDYRLTKFNKLGLPITVHCTPTSPVYYKGNDYKQRTPNFPSFKHSYKRKDYIANVAHPYFCIKLASHINNNINMAHFGGVPEWKDYIKRNIIVSHVNGRTNLFTDVSFTYYENQEELNNILDGKITRKYVLYGDDEFMIETVTKEHAFVNKIRRALDGRKFHQITRLNPKKFLTVK